MSARVLIALGQRMYREGLRDALTNRLGVTIVGEAAEGRSVLTLSRELQPDVVILQARLPEMGGAETTRQLLSDRPDLPVITISSNADYTLIMRVLRAGARAFVLSDAGLEELAHAFRAIAEGRVYLCPVVEAKLIQSLGKAATAAEDILTRREIEVLQLLTEGKSTKRAADILSVSAKTIETHRQHIMAKLCLHSIAELTKYAIRQGITSDAY